MSSSSSTSSTSGTVTSTSSTSASSTVSSTRSLTSTSGTSTSKLVLSRSQFFYEAGPVKLEVLLNGVNAAMLERNEVSLIETIEEGIDAAITKELGSGVNHSHPRLRAQRRLAAYDRALQAVPGVMATVELAPPGAMSARGLGVMLEGVATDLGSAVEERLQVVAAECLRHSLINHGKEVAMKCIPLWVTAEVTVSWQADPEGVPENVERLLAKEKELVDLTKPVLAYWDEKFSVPVTGLGSLFTSRISAMVPGPFVVVAEPVTIRLPKTFFQHVRNVSSEEDQMFSALSVDTRVAEALDCLFAVVLGVSSLRDDSKVPVHGLLEPVRIHFPVAHADNVTCAHWNVASRRWSTSGVTVKSGPGKELVCETTHFSLFGAILRSASETVACSNIVIFSRENVQEVLRGRWLPTLGGCIIALLVGSLGSIFLLAAIFDFRLRKQWDDEFLLVQKPAVVVPGPAPCDEPERLLGCLMSDAMKSALDDLASSWFEYFGEVRDFLERVWGTLAAMVDVRSWSCAALVFAIQRSGAKGAEQLLVASARRGTCVQLGISADLLEFVMTDRELAKLVTSGREAASASTAPRAPRPRTWRENTEQVALWSHLLEDVTKAMTTRVNQKRGGSEVLLGTGMDMILHSSLGQIFALDTHRSAKEKAGLFATSVLTSFVLVAAFFEGTGLVRRRPTHGHCESEGEDNAAARTGRFLVIAIASYVIAGLPASILESLMTRTIKKVEGAPGSQAWKKQLHAWRLQQRLFWTFSAILDFACLCYLATFIVNIDPGDYKDYAFAASLGLLQDIVVWPLFFATAIPILSILWAGAYTRTARVSRRELVRRTVEAQYQTTNLMLPLEHL